MFKLKKVDVLSKEFLLSDEFISSLSRAEISHNPVVYTKAVRVCLLSLGVDEEFICGEFRDKLEEYYDYEFKRYSEEKHKSWNFPID